MVMRSNVYRTRAGEPEQGIVNDFRPTNTFPDGLKKKKSRF